MLHRAALILLLAAATGAAQAQFRAIPDQAKRATLSHVEGMIVDVDGKRMQLAAGAQIRDGRNMIVVPTAVPAGVLVKYMLDTQGLVWRVWILSPQEAAQPDPKK
jgi:sirohydrochlorin ferrochelatase